ncbi:hypothetical protein SEA_SKINNYPETE_51 [Mycobacterium phage SkinnyPete]|uniref:Uncharacterized protein n=1 Tax=Mycobacterium phage SkinnyPete TaxID=1821539 RepID=A0A142ULB9_9CAUD|nr:hypothetical protein FDG99_gp51 [Mycobacterium phage SkinnyPete]AMU78481.1 hypothetical protein SEA_SKINNYPETE_51 [Mycobacterium phage SkinnyPete]
MNATDDGLEPLGEAPECGAVLGILRSADKIAATAQLAARQAQALNAIRVLHAAEYDEDLERNTCYECSDDYPCPTIRVIEEAGA